MKQTVNHAALGEIVYEESFWTGKKTLSMNGECLEKLSKTSFKAQNGQPVYLKGNYLTGVKAFVNGEYIQLTPSIKWYEAVLSVLPLLLVLIWGNSVALCKVVPIVGGAIGGLIGGIFACANLVVIKGFSKLWLKILVSVGMLGGTFGVCYGIALAILSAV